jgi:hypothetical protein
MGVDMGGRQLTWIEAVHGSNPRCPDIRELYRSANGEPLVPHPDDGNAQVLHEPNAASGGRASLQHLRLLRPMGIPAREVPDLKAATGGCLVIPGCLWYVP